LNGYLRLPLSTPFPRDPLSTARRQHDALVDLARRPSLHAGRLPVALREIAEKAAETLDVERIGIWFFTPDCRAIRCTELFERTPAVHSDGGELTALRYPVYFKALESERTINASDARLDPRTSAFKEAYLDPYGVMSMLDAPIRRLGSTTGCFEHTGSLRNWSSEEEHFASSISDLVAMAMDASDRRMTQEALRHRVEFETLIAAISTRFANASEDEIDAAMHDALADIGGFVGADRCITILLDRTDLAGRMMHRGDLRLRPGAPAHVRRAQRERAAASPSLRAQPGRRLSEHGRGPDSRVQRCHGQHARLRLARRVPPAQCPRPLLQSPRTGRVRRARPPRRRHSRNRDLSAAEGQLAVVGPGERAHGRRCDGRNHRRHHGPQACRDRSARQRGPLSPHGGELDRPHRPHHAGRHFSLCLRRLRSLLGFEPAEVVGSPIRSLIHPEDRPMLRAIVPNATGNTFSYRALKKDGSFVWFESTSRAVLDADGQVSEIISVSRDISERRRAEEQIEYQAYHDALTGLPNRLLFRDRLTIALAHARRQQSPLVVMFLDLDRFKIVNDTLGHSLGDGMLRVIAGRLRSVLREGDTIAAQERRQRHVPRQGTGAERLSALHTGHERPRGGASLDRERPAAGRRPRRTGAALPATGGAAHAPHGGHGGSLALEPAGPWAHAAGLVHRDRRGDAHDHSHRGVGPARGLPSGAEVGLFAHFGQSLAAPVPAVGHPRGRLPSPGGERPRSAHAGAGDHRERPC
jgi:PAS domain S-box-containing protein